ncbi:MAG: transglutaminase domain-containing protein [Eubacteriales bacterium]|nr:transglutaminase domain-containing protein [Eubacteriales bacterium]
MKKIAIALLTILIFVLPAGMVHAEVHAERLVFFGGDKAEMELQTGEQEPLTGWKTIDGQIFYFEESGESAGKMATGFYSVGGKDFYFRKTGGPGVKGRLVTGWIKSGNNLFYGQPNGSAGSKGALYTGLKKVGKETYYFKKSGAAGVRGKIVTGEVKVNGNEYYFKKTGAAGEKGKGVTGWVNLKRGRCYCSNGKILKNRYVHDYYVGKNGAMSAKSKKLYGLVQQIIKQKTNSSMSKEKKLKACFDYISSRSFRYVQKREFKNEPSWKLDYAYEMLTTKSGICYNFASAFGFIARELGYSPNIIAGKISSVSGGYTVHSWVEITIGGQAYVFDASMQHGGRGDFYKKKYSQTGKTYLKP